MTVGRERAYFSLFTQNKNDVDDNEKEQRRKL